MAAAVPHEYLTERRFGTVIWHRVTVSLGLNPIWPFPGTNEMFDCKKYVPDGLQPGATDTNGGCIWKAYIIKHNIPIETVDDKSYGGLYETALREAFFEIARRYPIEVLKTFVFYKAPLIISSLSLSIHTNFRGDQKYAGNLAGHRVVPYPIVTIGLLIASLFLALASVITVQMPDRRSVWAATLLAAVATIPAYIMVWAVPHTPADLLFYCIFIFGMGLDALALGTRWAIRRLGIAPAAGHP
jgi:hypothetical protein